MQTNTEIFYTDYPARGGVGGGCMISALVWKEAAAALKRQIIDD